MYRTGAVEPDSISDPDVARRWSTQLDHHHIMPRRPKDSKKSSSLQIERLYRKCRYCNTSRPTKRFDKHEKACKVRWEIQHERRAPPQVTHSPVQPEAGKSRKQSSPGHYEPGFVPGSSALTVEMVDGFPNPAPSPSIACVADDDVTAGQTGEH